MSPRKRLVAAILATLALCAVTANPAQANWPVETRRSYISRGYSSHHKAYDIAAPRYTPVQTVAPGRTRFVGWRNNCGGRQVYVYHGRDRYNRTLYSAYYHLGSYGTYNGEYLSVQENIGRVGTTGCSSGPHVHVERWYGYPWLRGSYRVTPRLWLFKSYSGVPNSYLPYRYR